MKSKLNITTILFAVLFSFVDKAVYAQDIQNSTLDSAFLKWAKLKAVEIDTNNLSPINAVVGKAQIVALGESAHGFHEMLCFRNAMFKYLVEKKGFTAIVLEANFTKSGMVNDYINGGSGKVLDAAQALTIGEPTTENVELINWMRQYNQQSAHKKIKFYGMDAQMMGFPGDTIPSHPAIDAALAYLKKVDPATARRFRLLLAPFLPRISIANYSKFSKKENERLSKILDELINTFRKNRSAYVKTSTKPSYEWALQTAVVARQTHHIVQLLPAEGQFNVSPDAWRSATSRDSAMAENVRWIAGREDKVFIYSHNGHVKNAPTTGGVFDAFRKAPISTGQFLRRFYGTGLVIFGISVPSTYGVTQPNSLETTLSQVDRPSFLLDLKSAAINPGAAKWLNTLRPMQANMVSFINIRVSTAFDAIVYFDKATSVIPAR